MNRMVLIILGLVFMLTASENKYEIMPTISGVFPEKGTDLKNYLSAGLRVGKYFDDEFINKVEGGIESTIAHYKDKGHGTGKRQAVITRYFVNGIKEFKITENAYFYALAGIGYENIIKKARYGNNDSPYGNYGIGIRYVITDDFYMRAEVRHAIKLHNEDADNNLFATFGISYALGEKSKKTTPLSYDFEKENLVKIVEISKQDTKEENNDIVNEQQAAEFENISEQIVVSEMIEEWDSDNDGISDDEDLCPNTPAEFKVDSVGCVKSITLNINFPSGKADIPDSFQPQIESVARILRNEMDYKVILEGHTDSSGYKELNLKLSEQRAKNVAKELIRLGIDESRVITEWFGSEKPVASNKSAEGRAENRRIEATFIK
jgi:OOP family OmpA-OmpF porin